MHHVGHWLEVLSEWDWLKVLLLVPILWFPDRFNQAIVAMALATLPGLWYMRFRVTGQFILRTALDIPILCLLCTVPLSLSASVSFTSSLPKLTGLLLGIALFFITARARSNERTFPSVLSLWLLNTLGIALVGLLATYWVAKNPLLGAVSERVPLLITGLAHDPAGIHPNELAGVLSGSAE